MLERLEQANLFVVSLDSKRQWYRYHALFAEALCYRLEQTHSDLVSGLHHRASLWYNEHDQTTQAILHALHAKEWHWAADLIERKSMALNALTWGVREHQLFLLRDWLEQIPANVIHSRPGLCLARIWMLMMITPQSILTTWINTVEAILTSTLARTTQREASTPSGIPEEQREQENMLGEALTYRAILQSLGKDGETALPLCQRAQALLKTDNIGAHAHLGATRVFASYASSINDAEAAIQIGLQTVAYQQAAGNPDQVVAILGVIAMHMMGTGRLHEVHRLTQQAIVQGNQPGAFVPPRIGWPIALQAEVLREWNDLDTALSLAEEGIKLCQQLEWTLSPLFLHQGYAILLRTLLSRRDLDAAYSVFQQFEHIDRRINPSFSLYFRSFLTIGGQVQLWLACGELARAIRWTQELDIRGRSGTPFTRERKEVARVRVLLAQAQPDLALQRLEPVLERATAGKRWGHVIEIRLLQALAYQMYQKEMQSLDALSEAVRLAEPEGYIRCFVDEGLPMAALLSRLQEQRRKDGPTPYLDMVLTTFPRKASKRQQKQEKSR
jgi:LuxR family maltose regulon positive regulatory protein